jgi:hypothetical protein
VNLKNDDVTFMSILAHPISKSCSCSLRHSPSTCSSVSKSMSTLQSRDAQFKAILDSPVVNLERLRAITWAGIPSSHRAAVWRLLLEYEPVNVHCRAAVLQRKRENYFDCVDRLYSERQRALWATEQQLTQIQIRRDLPRTPISLLRTERVRLLFERVLFIWSTRHPASGYVQGMNDLVQPFFFAFLAARCEEKEYPGLDSMPESVLAEIEADCYFCFSKVLDGLQDCFTKGQPGIYRMLEMLGRVVRVVNPGFADWMDKQEIAYEEFAFRWMNCLLVREMPPQFAARLWDLYVADPAHIASTHVYVCAAILNGLAGKLNGAPRDEMLIELQQIAKSDWTNEAIDLVLAQAYVYEKMLTDPPSHLDAFAR